MTGASIPASSIGHRSVKGGDSSLVILGEKEVPLGFELGRNRAKCLEALPTSVVRFYLSPDKKSVLGELMCLENSTRM